MVRKRVADLLQEEAQKFTPTEGESAIEVTATPIETSVDEKEEDDTSTQEASSTHAKRTSPTKADLEVTLKDLQETLDKSQQNEKALEKQIIDFQSALSEQKTLAGRLTKELQDAKKAALQLAEANSQLIEDKEKNAVKEQTKKAEIVKQEIVKQEIVKQELVKQELAKQELVKQQPKEPYRPEKYRKSYRTSVNLAKSQPDKAADDSSQMWLLD